VFMRINVNGRQQEEKDGLTVAELVAALSLEPRRVAVERNKRIVPRAQYAQTPLAEGDTLEIVTLVGGG
jgi:thiamine biosynthesis protein ThiS